MRSRPSTKFIVIMAVVFAAVGTLDSIVEADWDALVLFGGSLAATGFLAIGFVRSRREITMRADLVRWLERRAAVTGEPVEAVVDRAVAAYRTGLSAPVDD